MGVAPVVSPAWQGSRDVALSIFPDLRTLLIIAALLTAPVLVLVLALVATSALSFAAQAADMPVKAPAIKAAAPYVKHVHAKLTEGDGDAAPSPAPALIERAA